ncbi:MAG: SAM-dependent methyltransferase [Dermatophilaceae bacterium]
MSTPWRDAWYEALYGPGGLYRREQPHEHFSTATSPGLVDVLAAAVVSLCRRDGLGSFVDVAGGGGELASAVCALAPDLEVTCLEVRERPVGLPQSVRWVRSPGGAALPDELRSLSGALVLAHEWLDNVPCVVAERVDGALLEVCVGPDGAESLGSPVGPADRAWVERWWPGGARVEIGRARDEAWAALLARIDDGLAVAVDYGHRLEARPADGSLTAYRAGQVVVPVPDGSCDLTAHVAVDSLSHDRTVRQRALLEELGLTLATPDPTLAREAPAAYLRALARHSAVTAMRDPGGLGGFWWVLARRGAPGAAD